MAASVRQRLLNLARTDGRDFQTVLVAFGLERLVWRLSVSGYRDQFFLKGAFLSLSGHQIRAASPAMSTSWGSARQTKNGSAISLPKSFHSTRGMGSRSTQTR